jgi:hypothetical protein
LIFNVIFGLPFCTLFTVASLNPNTWSSSELLSAVSLYPISLSLLPRLWTLALLFVFCLPRLDLHTFAKWFIFLQKLQVFPSAGHLLACGNSPPQFLQFVFFFGSNFDCFCRYRRLLRRLGYDFRTVFADSLSLCSISRACFSDNSNARAEESNHVRSVSSRRTLRLSHVEWQPWIICDFTYSLVSANSQFNANCHSFVWKLSIVSSDDCLACLNLYTSYSVFFIGAKYSFNFSLAVA